MSLLSDLNECNLMLDYAIKFKQDFPIPAQSELCAIQEEVAQLLQQHQKLATPSTKRIKRLQTNISNQAA